jgi:putative nucleotidyltransferase with HDIG domain
MKRSAQVYATIMAILGALLGAGCLALYVYGQATGSQPGNLPTFLTLTLLCVVCRSMPLIISPSSAIDMSFMCIFACLLLYGPITASAMAALSTPFLFETGHKDKGIHLMTMVNLGPLKTLFNLGNPILSILLAGLIYLALGGQPGNLQLPGVLLPAVPFILLVILLNSSLLYLLFTLDGQVKFFQVLREDMVQLLPTFLCSAPIGYFMATLLQMPSGPWLAILFMLPLMLARYAFKLYLDNRNNYDNLIRTLTAAMEAKDASTDGHSQRVEFYAGALARAMGLTPKQQQIVTTAARLHDIGKIGINDAILNKPGPLTPEERAIIETHPTIGLHILEDADLDPQVKAIVLHHHEYYDGRGYPGHTQGDEVSIMTYILGLVDAFDVITSDRPYRKGRDYEAAARILREEAGRQFHPDAVEAMLGIETEIRAIMETQR